MPAGEYGRALAHGREHGLGHLPHLGVGQMRMHRQRKLGVGKPLTHRKILGSVAEVAARRLQMQRHGIVNAALDILAEQRLTDRVALTAANRIEVIGRS